MFKHWGMEFIQVSKTFFITSETADVSVTWGDFVNRFGHKVWDSDHTFNKDVYASNSRRKILGDCGKKLLIYGGLSPRRICYQKGNCILAFVNTNGMWIHQFLIQYLILLPTLTKKVIFKGKVGSRQTVGFRSTERWDCSQAQTAQIESLSQNWFFYGFS